MNIWHYNKFWFFTSFSHLWIFLKFSKSNYSIYISRRVNITKFLVNKKSICRPSKCVAPAFVNRRRSVRTSNADLISLSVDRTCQFHRNISTGAQDRSFLTPALTKSSDPGSWSDVHPESLTSCTMNCTTNVATVISEGKLSWNKTELSSWRFKKFFVVLAALGRLPMNQSTARRKCFQRSTNKNLERLG